MHPPDRFLLWFGPKPEFPSGGMVLVCPNCKKSSTYQRHGLVFSSSAGDINPAMKPFPLDTDHSPEAELLRKLIARIQARIGAQREAIRKASLN
jgi:hypothetical protein